MPNAKFLEGVSGGLANQWVANLLTPAFVFWAGGLVAILQHVGLETFFKFLNDLSEPQQIGLLIFALLIVSLSSFVMQRFDFTVLRWLEGYWPAWLRPLRRRLVARQLKQKQRAESRWNQLYGKREEQGLNAEETEDLALLEIRLRHIPEQKNSLMPTRLGNILRAAEEEPFLRYGLDTILCWPHLWLILPDQIRNDVAAARDDLNTAVRILLWGMLFAVWTIWAGWAIVVSLLVVGFAYGWVLNTALVYADFITATFTLHRFALYRALNWPLPQSQAQEKELAAQLNTYLARGYSPSELQYRLPET
ncbi:MAG: hypothetical protein AAGG51_13165 [Cyanobacteria bacterium P01_G01_bin.54]